MSHESRKTPALQYINEFITLVCAPDLLEANLFRNAAEITESFGAWSAVRKHVLPFLDDRPSSGRACEAPAGVSTGTVLGGPAVNCTRDFESVIVCVGDGYRPQTGALCAFLAPKCWQVLSVDPMLEYDSYLDRTFVAKSSITQASHVDSWKSISRLTMCRARIQDVRIKAKRAIFVLVHAHVSIDDCMTALDATARVAALVAVPCCDWGEKQLTLMGEPASVGYVDEAMASEKNFVRVWCSTSGWQRAEGVVAEALPCALERSFEPKIVMQPSSVKHLFSTALSKYFASESAGLLLGSQFILGRISGVRSVGVAVFYDLVDLPVPAPGARVHSASLITSTSEFASSEWEDYVQWYVHWTHINTTAHNGHKSSSTAEDRKRYQDNRVQLLVNPECRSEVSAGRAYNLRSGDIIFVPITPGLPGLLGSSVCSLGDATKALSRARWVANPGDLKLLFSPSDTGVGDCATSAGVVAVRRRVCR